MWQADVALCGPIRCQDEYLLADIGGPVVPIMPMVATVFSIPLAWADLLSGWVNRCPARCRSFGHGTLDRILWEGNKSGDADLL